FLFSVMDSEDNRADLNEKVPNDSPSIDDENGTEESISDSEEEVVVEDEEQEEEEEEDSEEDDDCDPMDAGDDIDVVGVIEPSGNGTPATTTTATNSNNHFLTFSIDNLIKKPSGGESGDNPAEKCRLESKRSVDDIIMLYQ